MIDFFIKGMIIGISVAAPVGPIGVLTIKRTLNEGCLSGFVTGMGAAFADTIYGIVVAFGLTTVSVFLLNLEHWLKLIGGLFLIFLGVKYYISKPSSTAANIKRKGLLNHLISTFLLTISNPTTVISFLAIFTGIGLGTTNIEYSSSFSLVIGVFLGSALWWLILSSLVSHFKAKISFKVLNWMNKLSGLIIITFGLLALYSCKSLITY